MKLLLIFIITIFLFFDDRYGLLIIKGNDKSDTLIVRIVNDEESRNKGLSGKRFILPGFGMMFIYDEEIRSGIWMKDMNFPIDVFWFKKDLVLDSIIKDIDPATYPNVFYSQSPVMYVLETSVNQISLLNSDVLDKRLDLDLTYINKHDKNIKYIWQILQHLLFHLR